jgi:putative transposase
VKAQARKNLEYRLYTTPAQQRLLERQFEAARSLYNAALTERREAYRGWQRENEGRRFCQLESGVLVWQAEAIRPDAPKPPQVNYFTQANQLKEIRLFDSELALLNFSACQDVLRRLDKAFKAFFERIKRGDTPGFPRYKGKGRYDSITWPSYGDGCKLKGSGKLYIQNVGEIRFKQHRNLQGQIKTVTIKKCGPYYYVVFSCQYEFEIEPHTGPAVGLDVGLEFFASQSDGVQIENPRYYRKSEKRLAKAQRKLERVKHLPRFDPKKRKARKSVACAHQKIRNQRKDFLHKQSRIVANSYSLIFVEDLQVKNLTRRAKPVQDEQTGQYLPNGASAKSGLAKSISDAGWSSFINMLEYKAVEAGSKLIKVNPAGTSQTCPECGAIAKKELSERWHSCECGASMPRDIAAARVILAVGLHSLGIQPLEAVCFS